MNKWTLSLGVLLIMQLSLAVALFLQRDSYATFESGERLLEFEANKIDRLQIEDKDSAVEIVKQAGNWVLPELADFPVATGDADALITQLASIEKSWPVATSNEAIKRFKVDEKEFESKLTLFSGEETAAVLYIGTSPGFRKVHLRPEGDGAVYAGVFNSWEAGAKASDWLDKEILKLDEEVVSEVVMPEFRLEKAGEQWKISDQAEDETTNLQAAENLVSSLANLRIEAPLDEKELQALVPGKPDLELRVLRTEGDELIYQFYKNEDAEKYLLKRSDLERHFSIPTFSAEQIAEAAREKLVQKKETAEEGSAEEESAGESELAVPQKQNLAE